MCITKSYAQNETYSEDSISDIILPDSREEAIRRILELADANGIDLCATFCQHQEAESVNRDSEPALVDLGDYEESESSGTTEIVVEGTRLAQIARRHYGNPDYWVFIYEANIDDIANPSEIEPGMMLEIPNLSERLKGMSASQIKAEVRRLKAKFIQK